MINLNFTKRCVLLNCICQTEVEVKVLKFLESCVVYEGEDVCFECLVSHEETPMALWKLQDVPLQNNEMNLIKAEGRLHSLTLRGVTTADSGTVTFTVGNHTSTASLTVRGKGIVGNVFLGNIFQLASTIILGLSSAHLLSVFLFLDTFSLFFQKFLKATTVLLSFHLAMASKENSHFPLHFYFQSTCMLTLLSIELGTNKTLLLFILVLKLHIGLVDQCVFIQ